MFSDRTPTFPCDILFGRPKDTSSSPTKSEARLESVHAFARERIKLASERTKTRYDSRPTDHYFKEGDLVCMYNPKATEMPESQVTTELGRTLYYCQEIERCCLPQIAILVCSKLALKICKLATI
ncbi:hypothetical protein AVEN_12825-1 [Araneus ventricosus]|uniref:Uncharacterized protein n=1 Tax=Araneus ventricosus TaxID=182803 RepID=A0A4Y2AD97_ARAVE|nr:hypothetical protein AVEN_12825-1 [Araneus ventricosus]